MSQIIQEVRTTAAPRTAISKSAAQFEAARRNRVQSSSAKQSVVVSLKDSAPGIILIGASIAEAIFVEPMRSLRRKFKRRAA